jgi:hypothetical protein
MPFNHKIEPFSVDISKTYAFEMTIFPEKRPKYDTLQRRINDYDIILSEINQGTYRLERRTAPIEAKMIVSPSNYDEKSKNCEITITCNDLGFKYSSRKEIVEFAKDLSLKMDSWTQMFVWFTDDGKYIEWIIPEKKHK